MQIENKYIFSYWPGIKELLRSVLKTTVLAWQSKCKKISFLCEYVACCLTDTKLAVRRSSSPLNLLDPSQPSKGKRPMWNIQLFQNYKSNHNLDASGKREKKHLVTKEKLAVMTIFAPMISNWLISNNSLWAWFCGKADWNNEQLWTN